MLIAESAGDSAASVRIFRNRLNVNQQSAINNQKFQRL